MCKGQSAENFEIKINLIGRNKEQNINTIHLQSHI